LPSFFKERNYNGRSFVANTQSQRCIGNMARGRWPAVTWLTCARPNDHVPIDQ
jgi:hypothetical protein